ncbi:uncharacterized protein LOC125833285 [Solanum verrucosum]|uniref:uncharacterized protein LOC125833285 n=1 Tax=Solanum verrucosum TaxID=315347 RepID=UPI0020CFF918|nr:uncharacterized protein LOC125833285 [Solanum verrucosum]
MAPYEALYGRRCRSPIGWFDIGEAELIGPNFVHQAMEKVKIILERLKTMQSQLAVVHPVFHVSMLKKCLGDPSFIVATENIGIKDNLPYEEMPVQILDRQIQVFRVIDMCFVDTIYTPVHFGEPFCSSEGFTFPF